MKFIADVMLGRLAKQLRLLGFDVLYDRILDDNEIIRLALAQDRLILTRDTALSERPLAANHLFIIHDDVRAQIQQVLAASSPNEPLRPLTRCSECNELLVAITREDARDLVPAHVYRTRDAFLRCSQCGRVYWTGTHVQKMGWGNRGDKTRETRGRR
jgi:uncharacterized protein with PIN domain